MLSWRTVAGRASALPASLFSLGLHRNRQPPKRQQEKPIWNRCGGLRSVGARLTPAVARSQEGSPPLRLAQAIGSSRISQRVCHDILFADDHRRAISAKNGMTPSTILVDGFVAGTWRVERRGRVATLALAPFRPLARRVRAEIEAEAEPLLRFVEEDAQAFEIRLVR